MSTILVNNDSTSNDLLKIVLAIILPPMGVALETGINRDFWINVLLTLLGWLPGVLHAVYVIAKH